MSTEHDVLTFFTEKSKSTATVIKEHGEQVQKNSQQYTDIMFGEISTQLQKLDKLDQLDTLNYGSLGDHNNDVSQDTIDTALSETIPDGEISSSPFSLSVSTAFDMNTVLKEIQNSQPISSFELQQRFNKPFREVERFVRVLMRKGLIISINGYCEVA